ncbi:GNAT family N-acetyltransferase [Bacillus sonorensis]|uniref:GNAT family N-acetyltransferase n=1 Tax=Bacillus sonorensis TaxID=119858 RepID=UPI0028531B4C|nr:GNAT family N-acetyltransferase [Bacillus sonorensis]MDR4956963.1 GNAT family N-acetyltransferase [Bacillus sonorensis]
MDITIRKMTCEDLGRLPEIDDSFIVDSILLLTLEGNRIRYSVKPIQSCEKSYTDESEPADYSAYLDNPDQAVYLAFFDNQPAGQVAVRRYWNEYAYIEDIKVDPKFRRHGIGRKLIEQVKRWSQEKGLAGITLETQNNNVKACRFYESCGFEIGGFDLFLYKGIDQHKDEIALYWYLTF